MSLYEKNLDKNKANFVPLTPLTFLKELKTFIQIMRHLFMKTVNLHGVTFIKDVLNLLVLYLN